VTEEVWRPQTGRVLLVGVGAIVLVKKKEKE
jgi:hypothetical protein